MPLLETARLSHMLSEQGYLSLYADEAEFAADREHLDVIERFGIEHEVPDRARLRQFELAISPTIRRAKLLPHSRSTSDPLKLVTELVARVLAKGGCIETGEVVDIDHPASLSRGGSPGTTRRARIPPLDT